MRPDLRLQLLALLMLGADSQHREQQPEEGSPVLSAQVKRQVILPELSQARMADWRPSLLEGPLPETVKLEQQSEQGFLAFSVQAKRRVMPQARLLLAANWRPPLLEAQDFLLLLARVRQCSRGPGPCALSQERQVVQKCNRAVRCGDHPIFDRCQPPHKARGLADCDNRCSRSQRKRARRVRPFQIAALDKYPCLPRQLAD
jgi:hypothetical protein